MYAVLLWFLFATCLASTDYVPNEFLIGVKSSANIRSFTARLTNQYNLEVKKFWDFGKLKVVHVVGDYADIERVEQLIEVKYCERNGHVYALNICGENPAPGCWGLDRIDQRLKLPYTDPQSPAATYTWANGSPLNSSVRVFVLDSGIDVTHPEFGGRAVWGYTAYETHTDGLGHGTLVAGVIGSASYGVAKNVNLVAVKVIPDGGLSTTSAVLDGMEYVRQEHRPEDGHISVASMSMGSIGATTSVLDAVEALSDEGVVVVVAAGNHNGDACQHSPAQSPYAITVGATDINDRSYSYTNWGSCVDVFAPGVDVLSTFPGGETAVESGTSMAAPYVAGVVALYLQQFNPMLSYRMPSPTSVADWLKQCSYRRCYNLERRTSPRIPKFAPVLGL